MKPQVANNPYHNPFYNRFNDPCRQRLDDMQSHEYTLWLGEKSHPMSTSMPVKTGNKSESHRARALMSLAILLGVGVLISAAFLFR